MNRLKLPNWMRPSAWFSRPWLNREVFGWGMFDFANQAFTLVILTAMFQVYFIEYIIPGGEVAAADGSAEQDHTYGRRLWAMCGIITQVMIIILGPILGALADFTGAKKRLLFITWIGCVVMTMSLGLIPPNSPVAGIIIFIVAYLFYGAGENFMASFLPEISTHRTMGRVSAFGWTLGYIGGLVCLAGAVVLQFIFDSPTSYRVICLWAGVFFFFGGLPTFLLLRERKQPEEMPEGSTLFTIGFRRLHETYLELRDYQWLFRYLPIMTVFFCGLQIVYWFGGTLARQLFGFSEQKMGLFILQLTLTAIAGAIITANVQDRVGTRNFLLACMVFWMVTIVAAALATQEWMFWTVGNAVGLGIGALGTASRAMVGLLSPEHKAAEFFGFYGLAHKLAAIVGLGSITAAEFIFRGNFHLVVASGVIYFVVGFVLLWTIDEKAGRTAALRSTRNYRRRHGLKSASAPES